MLPRRRQSSPSSARLWTRGASLRRVPAPAGATATGDGNNSPEARSCVGEVEAEEELLLYRVPIFDPALTEFCSPPPFEDPASSCCYNKDGAVANPPTKPDAATPQQPSPMQFFPDGGHASFEPTDAELREFSADMEALLGRSLDDGNEENSSFYMGHLDPAVSTDDGVVVKMETESGGGALFDATAACHFEAELEASDEMLDINFDYGSPQDMLPDEKAASSGTGGADDAKLLQRSLSLTLNYEAIIQSWGSSPWTGGGDRSPHVELDDRWPHDYTGMWMVGGVVGHGSEELSLPRLGTEKRDRVRRR